MTDLNIPSLMSLLPQVFLPDQAKGISALIYFDLPGESGGDWSVKIDDQTCKVVNEKAVNPDLTLHAKDQDILDIFTGRLDPSVALLFGKLRIDGDMRLAMKLVELFDTRDARLRQWKK